MIVNNIERHTFTSDDIIFLDTNIWLSIYGPLPYERRRSQKYSASLRDIYASRCNILTNSMVISEFINVYARFSFNTENVDNKYRNFKEFRNSPKFKPVAEDISINVKRILGNCERCNTGFMGLDFDDVLGEFENGNHDFNDQLISRLCINNKVVLITDDADFSGESLKVLTANPALLRKNKC